MPTPIAVNASIAIAASASEQINHVLPKLPRGWYRVCASLNGEEQSIVERESAFVVVPPVPFGGGLADDVGVVVPRWTPGADDALCALIQDLEVGAARFGLAPAAAEQANADYWTSLRQLVRALAEREVDAVGMLLLDDAADAQSWSASADAMLTRCAAFLVAWQVGDETATASSTPSIADACAFVHRRLTRLAANARMAARVIAVRQASYRAIPPGRLSRARNRLYSRSCGSRERASPPNR